MRVHRQLLTGIWRRVHPDLFEQQPAARAVNERSMKQLTSLIDGASELHSALIKGSATPASPEPCELRFFVHDEAAKPTKRFPPLSRVRRLLLSYSLLLPLAAALLAAALSMVALRNLLKLAFFSVES